jgi:hypothetical protein
MLVRDTTKPFYGCFPDQSVDVVSKNNEIFSASDGTVKALVTIGDRTYLVIQAQAYYVTYGPFDSCFVVKNDTVKLDQKIGISNDGKISVTVFKGMSAIEKPERLFTCACKIVHE